MYLFSFLCIYHLLGLVNDRSYTPLVPKNLGAAGNGIKKENKKKKQENGEEGSGKE